MFGGDWADVHGPTAKPPGCVECKEDRDRIVDMTPEESWQPGVVMAVWRCPKCGREVVRGDGNERFV